MVRLFLAAVFAVALSGCSCGSAPPAPPLTHDGGAGALDGGAAPGPDGGADGGVHRGTEAGTDAGTGGRTDGGTRGTDAGSASDAGTPDPVPDAGAPDAGAPDAGTPDAGTPDAGVCLGLHQACDQTVGNCCFGLVCDLPFDGGSQTECREVIN